MHKKFQLGIVWGRYLLNPNEFHQILVQILVHIALEYAQEIPAGKGFWGRYPSNSNVVHQIFVQILVQIALESAQEVSAGSGL